MFRALCLKKAADPASFRTVGEWEEYVDSQGSRTADRRKGFLTLNGEIVKSQGELAVANWLALNGVPYEYERPYEYETADKARRQYYPDFYLPQISTYIEHFAVDASGNPPPAFGEEYAQSMEWKRALHRSKGTRLIETTFAQFVAGTLFDKLGAALKEAGQHLEETPKNELVEALKEQQEVSYPMFLMSVVRPFVSHAKNNRVSIEALEDGSLAGARDFRAKLFCRLMARLMRAYDSRLRAGNLVDFDDMILMAGDAVTEGKYRSPFRAVLVDEFQDISQARAKLVKALVDQRDDAMLMGVGDVRQAIYRFAGSDVAVFRHFDSVFGSAEKLQLTKTFRFNQGIADVSSAFVGEADGRVVSDIAESSNVVRIRLYASREARAESTASVLKEISDEVRAEGRTSATVLVLFRVNAIGKDLGALPDFGVLRITKMSIHRSKGLEADYVVVAGVTGGGSGAFPSRVADDELLQLVMPEKEPDEAEEQRLMYVALTRGRRAAYVVASSSAQSEFIGELIAMKRTVPSIDVRTVDGEEPRICPGCGKGHLVPRKGPRGRFFGCSRFPLCRTTEPLPTERREAPGSVQAEALGALGRVRPQRARTRQWL
jgi:DNA helicase-4